MEDVKRYLWLSQILLFGLLFICSLIMPSVAIRNGGVSNFGNHVSTIIPYTLGFLLCALFLYVAAIRLLKMSNNLRRMAYILLLLSFLNVLVLISTFPRSISWTYSVIHDDLGIILFAYQFVISIWFVMQQKSRQVVAIFCIESLGSIIGLLSIIKIIHFLFIGQVIGGIGFGLLLITCYPAIAEGILIRQERSRPQANKQMIIG